MLGLRARAIDDILVVEPSATRRRVIEALGITVVDPEHAPTGRADVSFDCAAVPAAFAATLAALKARGRAVVVAGSSKYPLQMTAHMLQHTEITITGPVAFEPHEFATVIDLMAAGAYPLDSWVEHVPFAQLIEEGVRPLLAGEKTKVLIDL